MSVRKRHPGSAEKKTKNEAASNSYEMAEKCECGSSQ